MRHISTRKSAPLRPVNPLDVGSNLGLWLDCSDLSTIVVNSGYVALQRDKGPLGNDVSQSNASNQPQLATNAFPVTGLRFYNTRYIATATNANLPTGNSDITFVSVYQAFDTSNGAYYGYGQNPSSSAFAIDNEKYNGTVDNASTDGPIPALNFSTNALSLVVRSTEYVSSTRTINVYESGSLTSSNTIPSANANILPSIFVLGATSWGTGFVKNCLMNEIVCLKRSMTNLRQLIEGVLSWKWALNSALPINHPYRYRAPRISS